MKRKRKRKNKNTTESKTKTKTFNYLWVATNQHLYILLQLSQNPSLKVMEHLSSPFSNLIIQRSNKILKKKKQKELLGILRRPLSRAKSTKQNLLVQTISMQCFLTLERVITTTREKIDLLHDAFIIKCGASLIDVNYSSQ